MAKRTQHTESFEAEGFTCVLADHGHHVCGYVLIGGGHPWHGESAESIGHDTTYAKARDGRWWVGFDMPGGTDLDEVAGWAQDLAGAAASVSRRAGGR